MFRRVSCDFDDAYRGATWNPTFTLTSGGQPLDLTGWTVRLMVGALFTLTVGAGLTVDASAGRIVAALTAAQTLTVPAGSVVWHLELTDPAGNVGVPVGGTITFLDP